MVIAFKERYIAENVSFLPFLTLYQLQLYHV